MTRPLSHPRAHDITVAAILHALADPVRAAIVRELAKAPHGLNCTQLTAKLGLDLPKSSCSQHYRILREAGLIACERRGVELFSRVRAEDLAARFPGLLRSILASYDREPAQERARAG